MNQRLFSFLLAVMLLAGCSKHEIHFITDTTYRQQVETDFEAARKLTGARQGKLFGVMNQDMTTEEREAMMFLFAYMPLNDMADYDGFFFLRNVRLAFAARDTFSWGKTVPEDVFRHFVLPYRVNNENLDSARAVFFRELIPRVKNLTMKDAALEVNHWCHEKINYQGTDSRTISPLGAICTAYGRCGEESTFTATALRAVGIPARQVYTPRWAHVDDNHAWVEVWIDGKWQFLGACEPAPDLNQGWFAGPALRTMMVHTNAFGRYQGTEKVLKSYDKFARLNLLGNYAPTRQIAVKVTGSDGKQLPGATVDFGLYNYAEFYTLHRATTDENGIALFETGLGDIQVWACDTKGNFNLSRLTVETTDTLILQLSRMQGDAFVYESDNIPPIVREPAKVSESGQKENERRLAVEDSIRNAYISTFINKDEARALAASLALDADRFWSVLQRSRGNWPAIKSFFEKAAPANRELALILTETIAEKDLHDTPEATLTDHLNRYLANGGTLTPDDHRRLYVLNPRIDLEMLTPYRSLLADSLASLRSRDDAASAGAIIAWIKEKIVIDSVNNYYRIQISPVGVFGLRRSDPSNRDLFFVAACRALGIAARLEPATKMPQYYKDGWVNVSFATGESQTFVAEKGRVRLVYDPKESPEPLYYIHFSLARFDGTAMKTLEFEEMKPISQFPGEIELDPGYYRLLTGNRLSDGTVLIRQEFFSLAKGENKKIDLLVRHEQASLKVIARWAETPLKLSATTIVGWIDPETEPGRHFLVDMEPVKESFEKAGIRMQVFATDIATGKKLAGRLPKETVVSTDDGWQLAKSFSKATGLKSETALPAFIVITAGGDVVYYTSGYQIGTGEQLLKTMQRILREK
ncbi:MAG: hypothetical protein A2X11_16395 [Bacteroidetes bacterium GWE2_42_24]|nr:MAG: hypothetical protein A2X11_16395 [Bacteroidetes bacterium GWE2_42_24]OFY26377.1 MAG: hypothetical protein A2X09_00295 [Bacteroidetes bacterium GWF2_43_11]